MSIKGEYSQDWFSKNIPVWETLLKDMKGQPSDALEIGTYEGMAAVWLLDNVLTHPNSHLIAVDTFAGGGEFSEHPPDWVKIEERFKKNTSDFKGKVTLAKVDSQAFLTHHASTFNLIYVDGSHKAVDCMTDAVLSHRLLKKGGIIIFDDYLWHGLGDDPLCPKRAIDAFMGVFMEEYDPLALGYQVILRKKL